MNVIDEFVLNYTLQQLQKQIDDNQNQATVYYEANDEAVQDITTRVETLENSGELTGINLSNIQKLVETLQTQLTDLNDELVKTKLINLKQEIVIRTLHNLEAFNGTDMYADTFVKGDAVDWKTSIRGELLTDYQAIGKTRKSVVVLSQEQVPSFNLISQNGNSDEAMYQTFMVYKDRQIDKISIFVEPFNQSTYQPITISIRTTENGPALTSADLKVENANGWTDVTLPAYLLSANQEYQIHISTQDIYGYKIGMDTVDRYLAGTSFSKFGSVWTDNNYDIGFKVWCWPSADENDATLITVPKVYATLPEYMVFEAQETDIDGGVYYYVSRDGGANWKILQPGIETDLNDLPEGKSIVLKAVVTGGSRIEAWGYVIKRSDT
jgi:hypothetical protein